MEKLGGRRGYKVFTERHKSLKRGLNFKPASFYETLSWSKLVTIVYTQLFEKPILQ